MLWRAGIRRAPVGRYEAALGRMLVAAVRLDRGGVGGGGGRVAGGLPETSIWNVEMQTTASLSAEFEEDRRAKRGGGGGTLAKGQGAGSEGGTSPGRKGRLARLCGRCPSPPCLSVGQSVIAPPCSRSA